MNLDEGEPDIDSPDIDLPDTAWPELPAYSFKNVSRRTQPIFSLDSSKVARKKATNPFWRRCSWSPDGTHLLCQAEDHYVDLFQLVLTPHKGYHESKLEHRISVKAPTPTLAVEWYPLATFSEPQTWCFALSAREVPTKLINAYTGETRATYGIIDHIERLLGPQALAFSPDGTLLLAAHGSSLYVFDLASTGTNTYIGNFLLCSWDGCALKGSVSALSVTQGVDGREVEMKEESHSSSSSIVVALGTFSGSVSIFKLTSSSFTSDRTNLFGAVWKEQNSRGISQLKFHTMAPFILFVSSRLSRSIEAFDLRYLNTYGPSQSLPCKLGVLDPTQGSDNTKETQQRLHMDIDWVGRYLVQGDNQGQISVWNIHIPGYSLDAEQRPASSIEHDPTKISPGRQFGAIVREGEIPPIFLPNCSWQAAKDAIGGVSLHPHFPLLVIVCGSRRWFDDEDGSTSDGEESGQSFTTCDNRLSLFNVGDEG